RLGPVRLMAVAFLRGSARRLRIWRITPSTSLKPWRRLRPWNSRTSTSSSARVAPEARAAATSRRRSARKACQRIAGFVIRHLHEDVVGIDAVFVGCQAAANIQWRAGAVVGHLEQIDEAPLVEPRLVGVEQHQQLRSQAPAAV